MRFLSVLAVFAQDTAADDEIAQDTFQQMVGFFNRKLAD